MMQFTAEVYKQAADEHVSAASDLYDGGYYVLANYITGVAVESIFRAYRFRIDPIFDSRHDLRDLYQKSKFEEIIPAKRVDEYATLIDEERRLGNYFAWSPKMATVNALKTKLRKALNARFPGAEISIVNPTAVGKMGGTIVWEGFVGKDQIERHRAIREALTDSLNVDERAKLSAIFGMTPEELSVMNT